MPAMMRAATMPTPAKVPPTAPELSKKLLLPPLPLPPLSWPLTGRDEVLVMVMGVSLDAVAEMTEVMVTGS